VLTNKWQKKRKNKTLELMIFLGYCHVPKKGSKWRLIDKNPPYGRSWWEETLNFYPYLGAKVGNE
jgi:hypothetical protein